MNRYRRTAAIAALLLSISTGMACTTPDGNIIGCSSDGWIMVYDPVTGQWGYSTNPIPCVRQADGGRS